MGDNKISHNGRNHPYDTGLNSRVQSFLQSESPRVQQILLHHKLLEEIEKNSSGKVRYIDSELYLRDRDRSQASDGSEVQSTTLNIGIPSPNTSALATTALTSTSTSTSAAKQSSRIPINSLSSIIRDNKTTDNKQQHATQTDATDLSIDIDARQHKDEHINKSCQVCLLKEVRQDLLIMNKKVLESNEQISKLKAKCLRSYFERRMMD